MQPKKKPGRPPKAAGEKPEQFSIRLPSKLKYGLELLARAQGRKSLSQAIEWCVQLGLNTYEMDSSGLKLATVVDDAMSGESEFARLRKLYAVDPWLLEPDQKAACELVERSLEAQQIADPFAKTVAFPTSRGSKQKEEQDEQWQSMIDQRRQIFVRFVDAHWKQLLTIASDRVASGKVLSVAPLLHLFGSNQNDNHDTFAMMQAHAELAEGNIGQAGLAKRIAELDKELPWTKHQAALRYTSKK